MAGSHFTGPVYSSKGFYGPTYTYATLPAASGYQNNGATSNAFSMKTISNSAGTVEFGVSSAWCRVVQNPNV